MMTKPTSTHRTRTLLTVFAVAMLLLVLIVFGVIRFVYPPQALELAAESANPIDLLLQGRLWGPRYLVSFPAVLIAIRTDSTLDTAFTWYMYPWLVLLVLSIARTATTLVDGTDERPIAKVALGTSAFMVATLSTMMNGRLLPALAGFAWMLLAQSSSRIVGWRKGALLGSGLLCSMMSSGTMLVAFTQVIVGLFGSHETTVHRTRRLAYLVVVLCSIGAAVPIILRGLEKNLSFFGHSIVAMMRHGAGRFILTLPVDLLLTTMLAVLAGCVVVSVLATRVFPKTAFRSLLITAWILPLPAGVFGYSTMTMCLPPLMTIAAGLSVLLLRGLQGASGDGRPSPKRMNIRL